MELLEKTERILTSMANYLDVNQIFTLQEETQEVETNNEEN